MDTLLGAQRAIQVALFAFEFMNESRDSQFIVKDDVFLSDAVNQQLTAEDVQGPAISRVLIIYTGGTIGMKNTPEHGYLPSSGFLSKILMSMTRFHDPSGLDKDSRGQSTLTNSVNVPVSMANESSTIFPPEMTSLNISAQSPSLMPSPLLHGTKITSNSLSPDKGEQDEKEPIYTINDIRVRRTRMPALISPLSLYGKRTRYSILEYDPLLDSSNMTMNDWAKIATDIEINYKLFDAFIILHGTDTMAYSASALSFMLENLGKTVIITGSQVPLSELRNDGVDNLLGALTIASHFVIPEVGLYFDNKLFRGNRCSKMNAIEFDAFDSPNLRPLVKVGINIDVSWSHVWRPTTIARFRAQKITNTKVAALRLFPGIPTCTVEAFLSGSIEGLVLETFGAGNAPSNRPDLLQLIKEASDRGVVIVNCTQCKKGNVTDLYATGKALLKCGVIPGSDMTTECALTKLCYLLSKYPSSPSKVRQMMRRNLRGELTLPIQRTQFTYLQSHELVPMIMSLLRQDSNLQMHSDVDESSMLLEKALVPLAMCQAAKVGDVKALTNIGKAYPHLFGAVDYDGRTPLHIAASEGRLESVECLLHLGAIVHVRDRFRRTPLRNALFFGHEAIVKILVAAGAHFAEWEMKDVTNEIVKWILLGDVFKVKLWIRAGADINRPWIDGRKPSEMIPQNNRAEMLEFLANAPSLTPASELQDKSIDDIELEIK